MLNYLCFEKLAITGDSKESNKICQTFLKIRENFKKL